MKSSKGRDQPDRIQKVLESRASDFPLPVMGSANFFQQQHTLIYMEYCHPGKLT